MELLHQTPLGTATALAVVAMSSLGLAAEPIHEAATIGDAETVEGPLSDGTPVDQFNINDPYVDGPSPLHAPGAGAGPNRSDRLFADAECGPFAVARIEHHANAVICAA